MNEASTVVSSQTHVVGKLQGDENLIVMGRIDGSVSLGKTLTVEPSGIVVADIQVEAAIIRGTVVGNVTASDLIHIEPKGRVVGDLSAARVVLADGAAFRGKVEMSGASDNSVSMTGRSSTSAASRKTSPVSPRNSTTSNRATVVDLATRKQAASLKSSDVQANVFVLPKFKTAAGRKVRARRR